MPLWLAVNILSSCQNPSGCRSLRKEHFGFFYYFSSNCSSFAGMILLIIWRCTVVNSLIFHTSLIAFITNTDNSPTVKFWIWMVMTELISLPFICLIAIASIQIRIWLWSPFLQILLHISAILYNLSSAASLLRIFRESHWNKYYPLLRKAAISLRNFIVGIHLCKFLSIVVEWKFSE